MGAQLISKIYLQFSDVLTSILNERKGPTATDKLNLVIFVESAIGLLNLQNLCARGVQLSLTGPFHLDGVVFGSDDFCADIGKCISHAYQIWLLS